MEIMWVWVAIIAVCIGGYVLYKQGKLPWLKGLRMPKRFEPKPADLTEQLKARTEKEIAKAEELRKVRDAKQELAKARAENIKLRKEIGGISEKSVGREQKEQQEDAEKKVEKPRRL